MEIQLQELIDQIKNEGVVAAEEKAEAILNDAKTQAEKIISDASVTADKILADAKIENERMVKTAEDAIRQAGRNLLISLKDSVTREMNGIISKSVSSVYSPDSLAKLIIAVVESWAQKPDTEDVSVILNSSDLKTLEDTIIDGIKNKLNIGVTLKPNDNFDGGFRISVNNDNAYYDYSAEAVVEMLSKYLSPKVAELLKEAE